MDKNFEYNKRMKRYRTLAFVTSGPLIEEGLTIELKYSWRIEANSSSEKHLGTISIERKKVINDFMSSFEPGSLAFSSADSRP